MSRLTVVSTETGDLLVFEDMPEIQSDPVREAEWLAVRDYLTDMGFGVLYFDFPVEVTWKGHPTAGDGHRLENG